MLTRFGAPRLLADPRWREILVPHARVVANLNLDMLGRSGGSVYCLSETSADLERVIRQEAVDTGLEVRPDPHPEYRLLYYVDGGHFAQEGIPTATLYTGFHADYHTPGDTPDKLDYPNLSRLTDLALRVTRHYAAVASKSVFVRPAWLRPFQAP